MSEVNLSNVPTKLLKAEMKKRVYSWRKNNTCSDCGAKEGELHNIIGCKSEECPNCFDFLFRCGCFTTAEQLPYRKPNIFLLWFCAFCGEIQSEFFRVPDEEWKKYVIPSLQERVLCRDCYETEDP